MFRSAIWTTAAFVSFLAMSSASGEGAHHAGHSANRAEQALPRYEARFRRSQPVVAVVAHNPSTEITDFVVPYGVLSESGVATVLAVTTGAGPIQMSAGPRFGGHATLAQFDARYPEGADYVIVPAIYEGENYAPLIGWLRQQARRGATIVGICDGVRTLANTGLLEGRPATTHWRSIDELERRHPGTRWTRNTRYLADGKIITTSGVSASIPVSIALVEAIAGQARAQELARTMGAADWSARHNSEQFRATAGTYVTGLGNKAKFWNHEELGIAVGPEVDEIRVALIADVYARTRRSTTLVVSDSTKPVRTRRGLAIHADRRSGVDEAPGRMLSLLDHVPPVQVLDHALSDIAIGYGIRTAAFVALSMEYEWKGAGAVRPPSRDFGFGPRPSAKQVYTATLEPRQPIRVRELMTIPVRIADAQGRLLEGARISVDGGMPEHGHGLPTHPRVSRALGDGVYEIQGVRFNMRGWWELKLAIESPAGADSVTFNLSL
jgi:putative intracellular protease/amidase